MGSDAVDFHDSPYVEDVADLYEYYGLTPAGVATGALELTGRA